MLNRGLILFSVLLFNSALAYAQNSLSGVYQDRVRTIEIFNDKFIWSEDTHDHLATWYSSVWGEATYSWVDEEFIELHAEAPNVELYESMRIIQSKDTSYDNHIKVVLLRSATKNDLSATLHYWDDGECKTMQPVSSDKESDIFIIPCGVRKIALLLEPRRNNDPIYRESGLFFYSSVLHYKTPVIEINDSTNKVEIEINGIDKAYFGRCYPNGEYVQVRGDTIFWRGHVLVKSNLPIMQRYIKEIEKPKWWKKETNVGKVRIKVREYLGIE